MNMIILFKKHCKGFAENDPKKFQIEAIKKRNSAPRAVAQEIGKLEKRLEILARFHLCILR